MYHYGYYEDYFEDDEPVTEEELSDRSIAIAILENGTLAEYDAASEMGDNFLFTQDNFHHLGRGKVHSVDGILITDDNDTYNFFVRTE